MRQRFVLTAGRTGFTGKLGKGPVRMEGKKAIVEDYQWKRGEMTIDLPEEDMQGVVRYLRRTYRAYPAGSAALQEAIDQDIRNPQLQTKLDQEGVERSYVEGDIQIGAVRDQAAAVPAHGVPGGAAPQGAAIGRGAAGAAGGGPGAGAAGDGPGDARKAELTAALHRLDPMEDEHWTQDGRPRIDAVEAISGMTGVSRAEVDAAKPNFTRP